MRPAFSSPPAPPPSPSNVALARNSNPYDTHKLSKIDLTIAQQQLKWEQGVWSESDRLLLKNKITSCYMRKEAHWDTARSCAKKSKLVNLPKLILSTVLASSLTMATEDSESSLLRYFNTIISIILALMTTVSTFLDYDVQKAKHRSSSLGYGKLAVHIDRLLRLPPDERNSFGKTLAKVNEQYGDLRREAPFIKSGLLQIYAQRLNDFSNETKDAQTGINLDASDGDNTSPTENYELSNRVQTLEEGSVMVSILQEEVQKASQDRARIARVMDKILDKVIGSEHDLTPIPTPPNTPPPSQTNNNGEASTSSDHINLEIPELSQTGV